MADVLRWERRKTRKPHRCFGCGNQYPAGAETVSAAYADGGRVYSCYWCETCEEYMHRYFGPDDGIGQGEIYANDPEGWNSVKAELEAGKGEAE